MDQKGMVGFKWVPASDGKIPEGALVCGRDKDGLALYAARAKHKGNTVPGKAKRHRGASIGWDVHEYWKKKYEVLVCNESAVSWVFDRDGKVPEGAIEAGYYKDNREKLYLGRALHHSSITPGKVHPSHNCIYLTHDQVEVTKLEYEVLVAN